MYMLTEVEKVVRIPPKDLKDEHSAEGPEG